VEARSIGCCRISYKDEGGLPGVPVGEDTPCARPAILCPRSSGYLQQNRLQPAVDFVSLLSLAVLVRYVGGTEVQTRMRAWDSMVLKETGAQMQPRTESLGYDGNAVSFKSPTPRPIASCCCGQRAEEEVPQRASSSASEG
jgi:hypothetical protein